MPKTVRFCINCGREIGEALNCTNPECGGIPNFYRDVPGPDHDSAFHDEARGPRQDGGIGGGRSMHSADQADEPGGGGRRTISIETKPVAVLRSTGSPAQEHPIGVGTTDVGARRPAKIVIDRPEVSSRHAQIECVRDLAGGYKFTLQDHGSTNGTFLNGKRIQTSPLKAGDRVRFASVEFLFQLIADDQARFTIQM